MLVNKRLKFVFKIVSLGDFHQTLEDSATTLIRPCIWIDENKKRWGNEYLLFRNVEVDKLPGKIFLGTFDLDKRRQKNLKLFEPMDIPIEYPDYYILTIRHAGEGIDKNNAVNKKYPNSFSQVFSTAYLYDEKDDSFKCQSMFILQNGDEVILEGVKYFFNARIEKLEVSHDESHEVLPDAVTPSRKGI